MDSSTPPGYQFCIQQPGEVVCLVSFQQFFIYAVTATVTVLMIIIVIVIIIIILLFLLLLLVEFQFTLHVSARTFKVFPGRCLPCHLQY